MCDFVQDCTDGSDEEYCPTLYSFDDCAATSEDGRCYWVEDELVDGLDWVIKNINDTKQLPHGPKEGAVSFLFLEKAEIFKYAMDMIKSPIYQNSNTDCTLKFDYYIVGDLGGSSLEVAFYGDDVITPFDFLHSESKTEGIFLSRAIGLGRRKERIQVLLK